MEGPAKPESIATSEHSAKQLLAWQFMGVVLAVMVWSVLDVSSAFAAVVGGAVVLIPNASVFYLIQRTQSAARIYGYGFLRTASMIGALLIAGSQLRSQLIPLLTTAGVAILVPIATGLLLSKKDATIAKAIQVH